MAIIKLFDDYSSNASVQFAPKRKFASSSVGGITGSINIIVNRSHTQKDNVDLREGLTGEEGPQKFTENTFEGRRQGIYAGKFTSVGQGNIFSEGGVPYNYELQLGLLLDGANPASDLGNINRARGEAKAAGWGPTPAIEYDDIANFPPEFFRRQYRQLNLNFAHSGYSDLPMHPRNAASSSVGHFYPGTSILSPEFRKKEIIRTVLDSSAAVNRPNYGWGYGNYHCVNFFGNRRQAHLSTSDTNFRTLQRQPAIVYDSPDNRYLPTDRLQIEFFVKVNRHPAHAGTLLHLPGAFALSITTGSLRDNRDYPTNFGLMLQMGSSAITSSLYVPGNHSLTGSNAATSNDKIYVSEPMLTSSYWHHCAIRYSALENQNTGSFMIDGRPAGSFVPPPGFTVNSMTQTIDKLFLGAYYIGSSANSQKFFTTPYFLTLTFGNGSNDTTLPANGEILTIQAQGKTLLVKFSSSNSASDTTFVAGSNSRGTCEQNIYTHSSRENTIPKIMAKLRSALAALTSTTVNGVTLSGYTVSAVGGSTGARTITLTGENLTRNFGFITGSVDGRINADANSVYDATFTALTPRSSPSFYGQAVKATSTSTWPHPSGSFICGLDAEFHELKIGTTINSDAELKIGARNPVTSSSDLLFHLPVLYSSDAPKNYYMAMLGDLNPDTDSTTDYLTLSDFYEEFPVPVTASFDSPFNTHQANIGALQNINAQAFLKDFANNAYPYLHRLSSSVRAYRSTHEMTSSEGYASFQNHKARNLLILPCDNGNFKHSYACYPTASLSGSVVSAENPHILDLSNLGDFTRNYDSKLTLVDDAWTAQKAEVMDPGTLPDRYANHPATRAGSKKPAAPTMPSPKFFDPGSYGLIDDSLKSSPMVSVFSIPTLFYGNRIRPKSLSMHGYLYDFTGSYAGSPEYHEQFMRCKIVDDGYGNLLRADTSGSLSLNNYVGSVYYEDGIVAIKSPHLYSFGEKDFTIEFEGEQNTHMFELVVPVKQTLLNSSSNPNFADYAPTDRSNESADTFVYLSGVNIHDENLNIIGKATFAQPIVKRAEDRFLVRLKFDF